VSAASGTHETILLQYFTIHTFMAKGYPCSWGGAYPDHFVIYMQKRFSAQSQFCTLLLGKPRLELPSYGSATATLHLDFLSYSNKCCQVRYNTIFFSQSCITHS